DRYLGCRSWFTICRHRQRVLPTTDNYTRDTVFTRFVSDFLGRPVGSSTRDNALRNLFQLCCGSLLPQLKRFSISLLIATMPNPLPNRSGKYLTTFLRSTSSRSRLKIWLDSFSASLT